MAMVQPKSQKARLFITHLLLLLFIAAIMFPLLMVVAISLRQGNFATGSLIPEQISWDHWKLALGFSVEQADGRITPPPFPVLLWLWNSVKVAGISAIGIVALSTTCAYAFARMRLSIFLCADTACCYAFVCAIGCEIRLSDDRSEEHTSELQSR